MKKALISGITGQDASYLAELLITKGYDVYGTQRRTSTITTERIDHIFEADNKKTFYADLADANSLINVLLKVKPDEVYNIGSMSHVRISFDIPEYTAQVTGVGALRWLEALRSLGMTDVKYYQASSSEMFGISPPPQNENTPMLPQSPYGCFPAKTKIIVKREKNHRYGIIARKISANIEDICVGDEVLSYNEVTGEKEWDKVARTMVRGEVGFLSDISLANGNKLTCTGEHPIYVVHKGWVDASELQVGDKVIQYKYGGLQLRIKNIARKGLSYNDIYGEKAQTVINKIKEGQTHESFVYINGVKTCRNGLTYKELYGEEKAQRILNNKIGKPSKTKGRKNLGVSLSRLGKSSWNKGKSWDDMYGEEGAKTRRVLLSSDASPCKRGEVRLKISDTVTKLWQDVGYRERALKERDARPNKEEAILGALLDRLFPNEYRYVGNKALWIARANPDWVHKTKNKVIEYFGEHWHELQEEGQRVNHFRKHGYDCLVIWGKELGKKELENKIETYSYNPNVEITEVQKISKIPFNGQVYNLETSKNHNYFAYGVLVHNCAKLYAYHITKVYRAGYGMFACNGILFNHESERRGMNFVTQKIVYAAVRIKLGKLDKVKLGNLDAKRDWGFAGDYVEGIYRIMQHSVPDDFVLATSEQYSVREFAEKVFNQLGLNFYDYVVFDKEFTRPNEVPSLMGDSTKARTVLGWKPEVTFEGLVDRMIKGAWDNVQNNTQRLAFSDGWKYSRYT